ncbi:NAD(P)/FAD-dependent oxidoreductase [Thermosulfurimonas sp. F29]|uniref:NAD(P)/FAD-dependent oxidoreductase n=1 Tax=Thermosulfurimonas sp. F29 TaxID=2867247 RepID=UPI001C834D48|nr:FAD-dependent oxidoreductase [Thermosulfurimonas sp. F29]MBX6423922.1 FAD-dependent oxidoreductase [Thermosulfurimonas sp. F29]
MEKYYDVVIVGCGPAGLQAAIHAARRKLRTLIFGKPEASALFRAHMENYFGFAEKVSGEELLRNGLSQALRFGAEHRAEDVVSLEALGEEGFRVIPESEEEILAGALILALGVSRRKKKIKGEAELTGKGVSYCVDCDGFFFRGEPVAVVGEESAAVHGALTLSKIAERVYLVAEELRVSEALRKELLSSPVEWVRARAEEVLGTEAVEGLRLSDGTVLSIKGVFFEEGAKGVLELATALGVALDPENMRYIQVDRRQATSVPGVFAAGDVTGPPFQVAKAVGEGCVAALSAADYLSEKRRTGRSEG